MSLPKSLTAVAALSLLAAACAPEEKDTVVVDQSAPAATGVDASAMSGSAPTTVNPVPDTITGAAVTGDGSGAVPAGAPPGVPTPTQSPTR